MRRLLVLSADSESRSMVCTASKSGVLTATVTPLCLNQVLTSSRSVSRASRMSMRRQKNCSGLRVFLWNDQRYMPVFGLDAYITDLRGGRRFRRWPNADRVLWLGQLGVFFERRLVQFLEYRVR